MRVNPSHFQTGMSEQISDSGFGCSVLSQLRREGMPQAMKRYFVPVVSKPIAELFGDMFPPRFIARLIGENVFFEARPAFECSSERGVEWYDALFVAFASDNDYRLLKFDLLPGECSDFGEPHSGGGCEKGEHIKFFVLCVEFRKNLPGLAFVNPFGYLAVYLRSLHLFGGVFMSPIPYNAIGEKDPQYFHIDSDGGCGQGFPSHVSKVLYLMMRNVVKLGITSQEQAERCKNAFVFKPGGFRVDGSHITKESFYGIPEIDLLRYRRLIGESFACFKFNRLRLRNKGPGALLILDSLYSSGAQWVRHIYNLFLIPHNLPGLWTVRAFSYSHIFPSNPPPFSQRIRSLSSGLMLTKILTKTA